MRTIKLLVLAPFAVTAAVGFFVACGGDPKPPPHDMPPTPSATAPDMPSAMPSASAMPSTPDTATAMPSAMPSATPPAMPMDAGAGDAGKKPAGKTPPKGAGKK